MTQAVDLDGLTKATRRREFDDGLMDFAVGAAFLVFGMLNWFLFSPGGLRWYAIALVNHRGLTILGLVSLAALIITAPFGVRRGIEHIRRSATWRDRGFVKPLRRQVSWPAMGLAFMVTAGMILGASWLMAMGRLSNEIVLRTLIASTGIGTGVIYFAIGVTLDLRRYLVVGLVGGLSSAAILFTSSSFSICWLMFGLVWVAVLAASGAWGLRQTLSVNPEPADG